MKKAILPFSIGLLSVALGLFSATDRSDAAFHFMRVYAGMAGANSTANIQYVELRMTSSGQNFVNTHDICFFDATGAPYARFTFPANTANGADEASILVATSEFDSAWAAGSPDFTFNDGTLVLPPPNNVANVTAIAGGADRLHPIRGPAGKISFGTDSETVPAMMCQGSFFPIDSIAYGTGYTGPVDHVARFNTDLPTAGTMVARMQGPICLAGSPSPCPAPWEPRNNSEDYALDDANNPDTNNPRNSSGQSGDIGGPPPDGDGDGVPDATDNCPAWPNPGQGLPNTWSIPAGDSDCDGYPDTVTAGGRARENFMGTDPVDWCADTTTFNDEEGPSVGEPLSPWGPDVNDNRQPNLSDLVAYGPVFNTSPPNPAYKERFDLNASNSVNLSDLVAFGPFFNKSCVP